MIAAHKELDKFLYRNASVFSDALMEVVRAYYGHGATMTIPDARLALAKTIQKTMILADLNGRKLLLMEADYAKDQAARFAEGASPLAPGLTFNEAVEDLLTREPRLAHSAAEVSRLYSTEHVFAMARSAEQTITNRAQEAIAKWMVSGDAPVSLEKTIQEIGPFSQAYAATVYRTNVANAYNQGRIEQAEDPEVAEIIVGFEYNGISDAFTRENHRAGFGTIAPTDDPLWSRYRPPNGYNCRCGLDFISRFEAERRGLWKDGKLTPYYTAPLNQLHADPGFKT